MHAEHIEMNASISPFDASTSSMTSEAMSWIGASKENRTTTKGIASASIEIPAKVKDITAWAKMIDAGSREIDAWAEKIGFDLTSLPPAARR